MTVPVGDPLLFIDSRDRVSLAINQGNFSTVHKIVPPGTIFIPEKGPSIKVK
jgi:S-adenosylmethionine hydrolase